MGRGGRKSDSLPKGEEMVTALVKVEEGIGAFGLQEAPVFFPTEEEFANPLRYIAQIRPQAEAYGICRIVPPISWNPPFGLDTVKFTFPTKLQAIHHLQERPAAWDADTFKLEYVRFLRKTGERIESWPVLDGEELDLCKLFNAVKRYGGHEKVTLEKRWKEVVRMVLEETSVAHSSSSTAATLCQLYEKHLSTFELYQTKVGSGKRWRARAKQEANFSEKQASSGPRRGGRKRLSGSGDSVDLEEAGGGVGDRAAAGAGKEEDELCEVLRPPPVEVETRSQSNRLGRRRQSRTSSGLNLEGSAAGGVESKESDSPSAHDLSEVLRPSTGGQVESRSQSHPSVQRKRRKTHQQEKVALREEGLGRTDQICEQCHSGAHEQLMLLCDRCDRGWHLYCLSPPLSSVPVGNWYCLECLGSESESFGFGQGQEYSFDSFRRMADRFKRKWVGTRPSSYADLEKEFWRVVEGQTAPVEVLYGSDLDTGRYGSGFPRASDPTPSWSTSDAWGEGARNPWNVNNFPKLEGSMLRLVHDNIPGVMVPWLYIGMLFSSFCWHYEDHCFYSVNYLHCGEPKSWYSVPGTAADDFEKVMRNAFPDLFEAQPDLLFQLVTMLNPSVLRDNGVPVYMTVQEPRNFVITFPRSYHGGFNHGFNCAEAVNFAPSDWLPYGGFGVERYRLYHKAAVLSHDELLCVVAKNEASCRRTPWLLQELTRIVTKERHQREYLWSLGMTKSSQMTPRPSPSRIGAEEDEECIICRYYLHLSAVVCKCRPGKAVCLQHARQLCECGAEQQSLFYRFTLAELDDLVGSEDSLEVCKVEDVGAAPDNNKRRLRRAQTGSFSLNNSLVRKVKGRRYRHAELADSWLKQARGAGRTNLRSPLLEDLLSQAEQFSWGGHDMDEVRVMVQKLSAAQNWARDVAACAIAVERQGHSSSGKAAKVSLAAVHKLVTVDPVPWVEPHLQTLKTLFEPACKLEKLIMESAAGSADVEIRVLQGLLQEANHSPFEFPGLQELKDIINSAQTWSERVRKALCCTKALRNRSRNNDATFDHLQALHAEGSQIHVKIPEKERLALAIESVEAWRHRALQLFVSSCTKHDLEESFKASELLVVHPVEVDRLEVLLHKVQGWSKRAGDALLQVGLRTDYEGSMIMIDDLLQEGEGLHVYGLEEMGLLKVERQKVSWMHAASQASRDYPTVDLLQDLIADARRLQLADCKLAVELANTLKDASAWEVKAEQALSSRGFLSVVTELASSAESIHAKLSTLKPIQQARAEARLWLDRALSFCKPASDTLGEVTAAQMDLPTLRELVLGLQKLPVVVEDGESFSVALAAAEMWICKAKNLKTLCFVSKQGESQLRWDTNRKMDVGGQNGHRTSSSYAKGDDDSSWTLQDDAITLQDAIDEGLSLRLNLPEITELQGLHVATRWCLKARQLVECSPLVKEVEEHLEEATTLSVTAPEYPVLQGMVNDTKAWLQSAAAFMPGYGTKGGCSEEQLKELIADADSLPTSVVSETVCLNDVLASHRSWKTKVQDALSGRAVLAWSELLKLQEAGEADTVHTDEEDILSHEVFSAGSWMLKCHESLARQPAYQEVALEELFLKMRSSVKLGMEYLEDDTKIKRERKCVCQRPINKSETNALHCDVCGDGYHPSCLGVTQLTRGQKQYVCPFCAATSSGILAINRELSSKIHATQRPQLSQLRDLLSCAQKFRCRLREKEILKEVVNLVELLDVRLQLLIEPALVCLDKHNTVNNLTLVAAQKAVETLEVRSDKGSLLQTVLAVNSWHQKVIQLLEDPVKPLLRSLARSLKEGLAIPVSGEDVVLKELKEVEASACMWAARAKEVINDQGRMPLTEVQALITEGEELPVAFGKELSALRERSVLYCVCKKPYDEDRAMIACDRCGEWYHFNCINLPEPESSDEDTDVALQQECESSGDFVCPHCKELSANKDPQSPGVVPARSHSKRDSEDAVIRKRGEGSRFEGLVRGKRSNRSSNKARGEVRHKWQSPLFAPGKLLWHTQRRRKQQEQPDDSVSASGRPCRRTAGRHSGFESFVLLMRSR